MRFAIFFSIVQSILFLGHWFFYVTLVRFLGIVQPARLLQLKIIFGLLSVSLILTTLLGIRYSGFPARALYTASASWLGVLYLFILAGILCWVFYGFTRLFGLPFDRKTGFEILFGLAVVFSLYGFMNGGMVRTTRMGVELPLLPESWKGKTAVWISDLHLGQIRNYGFSQRIADQVNALRPDIVFIGGDFYDGSAIDLDRAIAPFSTFSVPYGTYFITGNHEEFRDRTPYLHAVRNAGIRVLENEKVDLDGLQIIGVDYQDSIREGTFRSILEKVNLDRARPSILLKHSRSK